MIEIDTNRSALILIRHGRTKYTNEFPDLTAEGIEDIKKSASEHADLVKTYPYLLIDSSPAARAQGSAHHFLETIGIINQTIFIDNDLQHFGLTDTKAFYKYDKEHSTDKYGEMWLKDPLLGSPENDLVEPRTYVEARAYKYLDRCMQNLWRRSETCALAFTHFEIMAPIMKAIYGSMLPIFPIERELAPQNGEALIIQPAFYNPRLLTITGRGLQVVSKFDPKTGLFERVA